MREISILKNPIKYYAWGSHTAIPELLGQPTPSDKPHAELWMGAHPRAPSEIMVDGNWQPLPQLIDKWPVEILGKRAAEKFNGKLPFLFKVLAAAMPLSIQAHPSLRQAKEGFARENSLGIPLTSSNRSYRDENHKPEMVCALTPFWALNGFRKFSDMLSMLKAINPPALSREIRDLEGHPDSDGLRRFFSAIITLDEPRKRLTLRDAISSAEKGTREDPAFKWVLRLHVQYPGDIGVLSPLLLNVVKLEPGQAMFLRAGQLHAYLEGVGIELMANSDNVIRGGLTPKYVDVPELLRILNFTESEIGILTPEKQSSGESAYTSNAEEFRLSVIGVKAGTPYMSPEDRSVEIMICVQGKASVEDLEGGKTLELYRGTCILVPAAVRQYRIQGQATLYKASVP